MVDAPFCRIRGSVQSVHKVDDYSGGYVLFTPAGGLVSGQHGGVSVSHAQIRAELTPEGNIVHSGGSPYIDVIAPGDGITPPGNWTYVIMVVTKFRQTMFNAQISGGVDVQFSNIKSAAPQFPDFGGGGGAGVQGPPGQRGEQGPPGPPGKGVVVLTQLEEVPLDTPSGTVVVRL